MPLRLSLQVIHNYPSFTAFSLFRSASSYSSASHTTWGPSYAHLSYCCYWYILAQCLNGAYIKWMARRMLPTSIPMSLVISNNLHTNIVVLCNYIFYLLVLSPQNQYSIHIQLSSTSVAPMWHVNSPMRGCFCNLWKLRGRIMIICLTLCFYTVIVKMLIKPWCTRFRGQGSW